MDDYSWKIQTLTDLFHASPAYHKENEYTIVINASIQWDAVSKNILIQFIHGAINPA